MYFMFNIDKTMCKIGNAYDVIEMLHYFLQKKNNQVVNVSV